MAKVISFYVPEIDICVRLTIGAFGTGTMEGIVEFKAIDTALANSGNTLVIEYSR